MLTTPEIKAIDYLIIGHLTQDLTTNGSQLGGSVAYAALTAKALGLRVGIVTSWGEELHPGPLSKIPILNLSSEKSTTFENIYTPAGREQSVHQIANNLDLHLVPEIWRQAPIVHLAPVAQEVGPTLVRHFPEAFIGITPQGWLREWDADGKVQVGEWPEAGYVLEHVSAAVLSIEDVEGDEKRIDEFAAACQILAVTKGASGARLYWNGELHDIEAQPVDVGDPTGAGDIFAATFFTRLYQSNEPLEAARFANLVAAHSVQREGLMGAPTRGDILELMAEVN